MSRGFAMLRNNTLKFQMGKNEQQREFNDLVDGKLQNDGGKWRRACRPKSVFLSLAFIMFTLLLFSNFLVDPYASAYWNWGMPALVVQPSAVKCQSQILQKCDNGGQSRSGKDLLPRGIAQTTSDMHLQPLGKSSVVKDSSLPKTLLAIAAGIKQKRYVDRIVQKFLAQNSTIILFHYDGVVDKWHDMPWSAHAIHIVAINQTKWWFAKRFLHPDIVAPYEYIFVWDEDLGVENFHVDRYLTIMKEEGLEISQPALEPNLSEIHHRITIRSKKTRVHRRIIRHKATASPCWENSTGPPCTGWVEGMAPVFAREAWKCVWHLIQNDLVHGWGLDFKLGYCAKGDRSKKVGVIDSEYIVHRGIPSLGGARNKTVHSPYEANYDRSLVTKGTTGSGLDARSEVRRRSYAELDIFSRRWKKAAKEDECWRDPYKQEVSSGSEDMKKKAGRK